VFPAIKDHVLLRQATRIEDVDATLAIALTPGVVDGILAAVPDEWLDDRAAGVSADDARGAYRRYLLERLVEPRGFVEEAARAR
jgi:hypothetical protein